MLPAQQLEPPQTGATAAGYSDFMDNFTWHPGGTREADTWQTLILFGVGDPAGVSWDGSLSIRGGEILDIDAHRQEPPDRILPQGGWKLRTQTVRVMLRSTVMPQPVPGFRETVLAKGLWLRGSGNDATEVSISTAQGDFKFKPMAAAFGGPLDPLSLDGRVALQRTPPATDLSGTELRQHDSPAGAADADGNLFTTWYSYHDRREELNFRRYHEGRWSRLIPVGRAAEDLWRPQIATDADGKPWLITRSARPPTAPAIGTFTRWHGEDDEWGRQHRLSSNPLPDIKPHVARAGDGTLYVVWQSMAGRHSQIRLKYLRGGRWSETVSVTNTSANNWAPAVAAGADGAAWIAWDRYTAGGGYDVFARSFSPTGGLGAEMPVASTSRFEAHASIGVDKQGRPWVAWETSGVNWGKDLGRGPRRPPTGHAAGRGPAHRARLLRRRPVESSRARCVRRPVGRRRHRRKRAATFLRSRRQPVDVVQTPLQPPLVPPYELLGIVPDPPRRPPLDRPADASLELGAQEHAHGHDRRRRPSCGLSAEREPSMGLRQPAAAEPRDGGLAGVCRGRARPPRLTPYRPAPGEQRPNTHPNEAEGRSFHPQLPRRARRRNAAHRPRRPAPPYGTLPGRGRHRRRFPAGVLPLYDRRRRDGLRASTDHQAGGTDFWNAMTQKMADMHHFPDRFSTLYGYERNPGNPFGHRNMIYTHRDYPIVPFFIPAHPKFLLPDSPDGNC